MSTKVNIEDEDVSPICPPKKYKFHNMFEDKVFETKTPSLTSCIPSSSLPPLPPLQRAPEVHYKISQTSLIERPVTMPEETISSSSADKCSVTKTPVRLTERNVMPYKLLNSDGVSKLVMKNISRGTTRKKALIHSIPKFSQVLPNQQLAEAQRVLQERLLAKKVSAGVDADRTDLTHANVDRTDLTHANVDRTDLTNANVDRRASDILQAMVDMSTAHNQVDRTDNNNKLPHRTTRTRKPRKTEICHLKPNTSAYNMDEDEEHAGSPQDSHQPEVSIFRHQDSQRVIPDQVSFLPEITITRKYSPSLVEYPGSPLNLCTRPTPTQSSQPGHPPLLTQPTNLVPTSSSSTPTHSLATSSSLTPPYKHPDSNSTVTICKYNFTPGNNPSLEEQNRTTLSTNCDRLQNIQPQNRSNTNHPGTAHRTLVAKHEIQAGNGATFCTFKRVKTSQDQGGY
eukprot:GFUD01056356.1.p1 GENE.GFUD01056356.1~~GFUD01056356.1.p1  ORF type:complete len:454 (+),score=120.70 GFUD01056356.1:47-1408(+)